MIIDWPGSARPPWPRRNAPTLPTPGSGSARPPAADGHVVTGCNVENASYGLTLCAECGLVSPPRLRRRGCRRRCGIPLRAGSLLAVAVVAGDGQPLLPCGRCRQLLLEAGGGDLLVDTAEGPVELKSCSRPPSPAPISLTAGRQAP